jgi:hypothetical protein
LKRKLTVGIDHSIVDLRESKRSCKRGKKERDKSVKLHPEAKSWHNLKLFNALMTKGHGKAAEVGG